MSEKVYTVICKRGTTIDQIQDDLTKYTRLDNIPNRAVDIANPRKGSTRQTYFSLTDAEAAMIRNDPRVEAVEIPAEYRDDISIGLHARKTGVYDKTSSDSGNFQNWGLKRCISETLNYGSTGSPTDNQVFEYSFDGEGVDVVIQDSGIEPNHPEWQDKNGVSRLQQINWYTESGIIGTQNANHYRDVDGHGTHCAGITAGKTFGWAKGARIYSQKLSGLETPLGSDGTGIGVGDAFDTIRLWHANKSGADAGRPTVVNMSWGYGGSVTPANITTGNYRGTAWDFATDYSSNSVTLWSNTGFVQPYFNGSTRIPVRVASVDADVQEMIDAGIHICIAAGNSLFKIDVEGGLDWDNTILRNGQPAFYHRGSSPFSDEAFIVGNIDSALFNSADHRAFSSCNGPGCNMWAPGSNIMSACSNTNDKNGQDYYADSNFKQCNIGGTSMAAPQVAGVIACLLQQNSTLTPAEMRSLIEGDSKNVIYSTGSSTDYTNTNSICGSPNRMLFNRYNKTPFKISAGLKPTNGLVIRSG